MHPKSHTASHHICMAHRRALLLLLLAVLTTTAASDDATTAASKRGRTRSVCVDRNGLVGGCVSNEEEEMGNSRRVLYEPGQKFISYGALQKDRIPCNVPGQSYYNCGNFKQVNPYRRGCSVITRCARYLY